VDTDYPIGGRSFLPWKNMKTHGPEGGLLAAKQVGIFRSIKDLPKEAKDCSLDRFDEVIPMIFSDRNR
jgi:hypothetical protein